MWTQPCDMAESTAGLLGFFLLTQLLPLLPPVEIQGAGQRLAWERGRPGELLLPPMKRAGAPAALPPREALAWFALGCGVLFPWNCIVGASDYFAARFPPPRHPERALAVAYMLPNVCVVLGVLLLEGGGGGSAGGLRRRWPGRSRVAAGFAVYAASLAVLPALDLLAPAVAPGRASGVFGLTLAAVAAAGVGDGLGQGSLFGLAAVRDGAGGGGGWATRALVGGTAGSGVVGSLLRAAAKGALDSRGAGGEGLRASANVYFFLAVGACLGCLALARRLPGGGSQPPEAASALELELQGQQGAAGEAGGAPAGEQGGELPGGGAGSEGWEGHGPGEGDREGEEESAPLRRASMLAAGSGPAGAAAAGPRPGSGGEVRDVVRHVAPGMVCVGLVYWVTLSIFPGVLAEDLRSEALGDWLGVLLIFTFNLADMLAKLAVGADFPGLRGPGSARARLAAAAGRVAFVPLYAWAARSGAGEAPLFLLTLALGLSNGFLTAASFAFAPRGLPAESLELAGLALVLALLVGLTLGAFSGWLWLL